jgi:hypothetical protein
MASMQDDTIDALFQPEPEMDHSDCVVDRYPHSLPHRGAAQMRPCGHAACDPHTISYYGTGDDPDAEGEYCLICFGRTFGLWPDRTLKAALEHGD